MPEVSASNLIGRILERFPAVYRPMRIEKLGNAGGFSGAWLWKVQTELGAYCLRAWPGEHPTATDLSLIHGILEHVGRQGLRFVPAPVRTQTGETFVRHGGRLWELARWLPGSADFRHVPSPGKLQAALEALAEFHLAAANVGELSNGLAGCARSGRAASPGLRARLAQLEGLVSGEADRLRQAAGHGRWRDLDRVADQLIDFVAYLAPRWIERVRAWSEITVPLQVCLRDVWHDHILFEGESVSGIVDFGAMGIDCVSGDLARLLGSLVGDDEQQREFGLGAYERLRPLSAEERGVLPAFDITAVLLGGWTWLRWHYIERRHFADPAEALRHFDDILERLSHLAEQGTGARRSLKIQV